MSRSRMGVAGEKRDPELARIPENIPEFLGREKRGNHGGTPMDTHSLIIEYCFHLLDLCAKKGVTPTGCHWLLLTPIGFGCPSILVRKVAEKWRQKDGHKRAQRHED